MKKNKRRKFSLIVKGNENFNNLNNYVICILNLQLSKKRKEEKKNSPFILTFADELTTTCLVKRCIVRHLYV